MNLSRTLLLAPLVAVMLAAPAYAGKGHDDGPWHEEPLDGPFCRDNPATCAQARINHENLKKRCETDPEHCDKLKAERENRREIRRERREERREKRREGRS